MSRRRRIGLLGGSFDPVHAGHLHAARVAREAFGLERVAFVPAARPPHKTGRALAAAEHRLAMLELALAGEPAFAVCDVELGRPGPSYTIETVRELAARAAAEGEEVEIGLILGSDSLETLAGWREVEELLDRVRPIVVLREPLEEGEAEAWPRLRERLEGLSPRHVLAIERGVVRAPPAPVSSTELRARLAAGVDPGPGLDAAVRDYALRHGLYRSGA